MLALQIPHERQEFRWEAFLHRPYPSESHNPQVELFPCLSGLVNEDGEFHTCCCVKRGTRKKGEHVRAIQGRVERQEFSLSETVFRVDGIASVP